MKTLMLIVLSSLFFATMLFAGEEETPQKFLDLKPAALPAEKTKDEFALPKEECKNGLFYSQALDKCVVASNNTTSIEKSKKEAEMLKQTKGVRQRNQIVNDAKQIGGVSQPTR